MNPLLQRAYAALSRLVSPGAAVYRDAYDDIAATYDDAVTRPSLGAATVSLIERSGLAPGLVCLDCGCGTGHSTEQIARRVAPGGCVVGLDVSAPMIERARTRCAGVEGVRFVTGTMPGDLGSFAESSFDLVGFFWSMDYIDHRAGLNAAYRLLRPRGHIAVVVNLRNSLAELQDLVVPIMVRNLLAVRRIAPLYFLPDVAAFAREARAAGFVGEHLVEEAIPARFATGQALVGWMQQGGPAAGFQGSIRERARERILRLIADETDRRGGITVTFRYVSYLGTRP